MASKTKAEVKKRLLQAIKEIGESPSLSTRKACKQNGITKTTLMEWIDKDADIADQYASAKRRQAELMADEILEIADDDSQDELFIETEDGSGKSAKRIQNHEFIARSRLKVDTRKWLMSTLLPKQYGDKLGVEHSCGMDLTVNVIDRFDGK